LDLFNKADKESKKEGELSKGTIEDLKAVIMPKEENNPL